MSDALPLPDDQEKKPSLSQKEIERRTRLGETITRWRKGANLTQQDLADQLNIHPTTLRRYESGIGDEEYPRAIPAAILNQIAQITGHSAGEAFEAEMKEDLLGQEILQQILSGSAATDSRHQRLILAVAQLKEPALLDALCRMLDVW